MQQTEQPQSVFSFGLNSDATFFATPTPARDTAEESTADVIPPPSATSDFLPAETIQGIQSGSAGATSVGTSEYHPFASSAQNGKRRRRAGAEVNGMSMKDVAEHMTLQIAAQPVDLPCPAGFNVTVYNGDISQHYTLASETVQITRGSIKYVDHHARYGPQTRFRFQLCHNYLQRKCAKLSECSYIHATVLPKPSEVHLNPFAPRRLAADRHGRSGDVTPSHFDDPSIADAYPTMQPGLTITVHPPQGNQTSNELTQVPSEMIIRTTGAEQTIAAYLEAGGAEPASFPPDQLPRHCTKFQYRRVCTSGSGCPFIHSKIPFPGTWIGIGGGSTPNPTAAVQQQQQQQPQGIPSAAMFAAAQPYPGAFVQGPQGAAPGIAYATVPAAPAAPQMFFMPTPVPMDPHHQAATLVPTGLGQSWAPQPSFVHHPGAPTMMMAAPAPPPPQPQGLPYMFQPAPTAHGHHPMQYIVMMPPSAQ